MTFYGFAQLSDNLVTKSMLNSLLCLPSVDIKVTQISIGAICPTTHVYSTLDELHRHVLFEEGVGFIFYYSLIYSFFTVGGIVYLKICFHIINKLPNLEKLVKVTVSRPWHFCVVTQMNIVPDVQKSVSRHDP